MSTDGIQITIPDFTDDEYTSTPVAFGRGANPFSSNNPFGAGGNPFSNALSNQDSPTQVTPLAYPERAETSYFHARGDSYTSDDSGHSIHHRTRFGQTSQTSLVASTTANTSVSSNSAPRKSSFASLRNAFSRSRSATVEAPPPVPTIDHQAYPVLKNPFNRSNSSLAQVPGVNLRKPSYQAISTPPHGRPATPSSSAAKSSKHSIGRSQHSYSGSVFHASDGGSDHGHGLGNTSTPPPVPRMPGTLFGQQRSESPISLEAEDKVIMDPKTPSDYALHAVFMRYAASAEAKIEKYLQKTLDREHSLPEMMGPGVDASFDDLLKSLATIAQRHAKPVIDSAMRWRKSQNESVSSSILKAHAANTPNPSTYRQDPAQVLRERKNLSSIYIMCRTLATVLSSLPRDALADQMGYNLEETTFEQFKAPDFRLLAHSVNHRAIAELYATMLGHLSNLRFVSVTDRFLVELAPVASGQVSKDQDARYENLVQGLKHIQIKVWPPEAFEDAAEFMETLSKSFSNAHGFRLKSAFAETLVQLLHPIGKTAQAEVNHPQWGKAIETIYPKAKDMMSKPRYWSVAYPLLVTSLCVAPQQFFLRNWQACLEAGFNKLKEKPFRIPILNGMIRIVWTYLYRCQESASVSMTKLDGLLKRIFPPQRPAVYPPDEMLEPFVYLVHFLLSRHFDRGRDLCMELLNESTVNTATSVNISAVVSAERMTVSIHAILLSLAIAEQEDVALTPAWPNTTDFSTFPSTDDYPTSSDMLPATFLAKPGMSDFFERCGNVMAIIAKSCAQAVGEMSIFDEQWSPSRVNPAYDDTSSLIVRRHPEGTVYFPRTLTSQIGMLQTCFQSWPRCLHPALPVEEAVEMLVKGLVHVEPVVADVAADALRRFMYDSANALIVMSRFTKFLFDVKNISRSSIACALPVETARLLLLWIEVLERWIRDLKERRETFSKDDVDVIASQCEEIQAGALFLTTLDATTVHSCGVKVLRLVKFIASYMPSDRVDMLANSFWTIEMLHGKDLKASYTFEELLDQSQQERLMQWRQSGRSDILLRIADSNSDGDRDIWRFILPDLMQSSVDHPNAAVQLFRDILVAAATRQHPMLAQLAGLSTRVVPNAGRGQPTSVERDNNKAIRDNKSVINQWLIWLKILCFTASPIDSRPALTNAGREHSRAPSDTSFERERMTTTRGLFRYLTPFLDSEHTSFRTAAILCISSLPSAGYPQLLEDLSTIASRQFFNDGRIKSAVSPPNRSRRQERLHSAVAQIYHLTADFLKLQRGPSRQAALRHVLRYVRTTQTFLSSSDVRDDYGFQSVRRYFCGTVQRLFEDLADLKDSDRFIPSQMQLSLYRLCEEWCQIGHSESAKQRLIRMQRAAAASGVSPSADSTYDEFQRETSLLSVAAAGAMAALCTKALFPAESTSSSPDEPTSTDAPKQLDVSAVLERLSLMIGYNDQSVQRCGKGALKSILISRSADFVLTNEIIRRAVVRGSNFDSGDNRFFEVVADFVCDDDTDRIPHGDLFALGLLNLSHPNVQTRSKAFNLLETVHFRSSGILSMAQFEAVIGCSSSSAYLRGHRLISDFLAGEHPQEAIPVLSTLSPLLREAIEKTRPELQLLALQSMECWLPSMNLLNDDRSELSSDGQGVLYHLLSLTIHYGPTHADQVLALWTRLVDHPNQGNGFATVRFLLENSQKTSSTKYVTCATNVVACLSQTHVGRSIVEELCSVIEPARMLPSLEHKLEHPAAEEVERWSDLLELFQSDQKLSLAAAQYAFLILADSMLERQWDLKDQLPILLHAAFTHVDHRVPFVSSEAKRILFQLMRAWAPGYDELSNRISHPSRAALQNIVAELEHDADALFWTEKDDRDKSEGKMRWLCGHVVNFFEPLEVDITAKWGEVAVEWGTQCSIRAIAFRSLQLYRSILPPVSKEALGKFLGRLSNTIAAADDSMQSFSSEILLTLHSMVSAPDFNIDLLPQMFWCTHASLSTTLEKEFEHTLMLLQAIVARVDLGDSAIVDAVLAQKPPEWQGSDSLQSCLLNGLRSSVTVGSTMNVLQSLTEIADPRLIDQSEGRLRDLYTLSLPWCLHAMSTDTQDPELTNFARDIARLAESEKRHSIGRIMESFVKNRFRTKDDFLRQSVSSLREHYGVNHWAEVVTLLMSLVLNQERWLRMQAMIILKVLFQQRETRDPVDLLGSELLMPLLRLLETDLGGQALEVLEEPMVISGGLAAKHVLRMSMRPKSHVKDADAVADIFGMPEQSGWCVAHAGSRRQRCRANLVAIFDTCSVPIRPSRIVFEPEVHVPIPLTEDDDLGNLVQNLHELTTFFQTESRPPPAPTPSRQLEARVAAILAKSTEPMNDVPQTPLLDGAFMLGDAADDSDEVNDDSDPESDEDAFAFDLPTNHFTNGHRF